MLNSKVQTITDINMLTYCKDYSKPKYIEFIEYFLKLGFEIKLYNAKTTASKYIFTKRN